MSKVAELAETLKEFSCISQAPKATVAKKINEKRKNNRKNGTSSKKAGSEVNGTSSGKKSGSTINKKIQEEEVFGTSSNKDQIKDEKGGTSKATSTSELPRFTKEEDLSEDRKVNTNEELKPKKHKEKKSTGNSVGEKQMNTSKRKKKYDKNMDDELKDKGISIDKESMGKDMSNKNNQNEDIEHSALTKGPKGRKNIRVTKTDNEQKTEQKTEQIKEKSSSSPRLQNCNSEEDTHPIKASEAGNNPRNKKEMKKGRKKDRDFERKVNESKIDGDGNGDGVVNQDSADVGKVEGDES